METLLGDLRQSLRALQKNVGFTVIAVLALALGIGSNTAIFSVINKVLLQPVPYKDPDKLMLLGRKYAEHSFVGYSNSIPKYMMWRNNDVFSMMALYDQEGPGLNLSGGDHPQQVKGAHVSADYFKVFGVFPKMGRTFSGAEDLPSGPKAAIISESLWRNHFGADPEILKRTMALNAETYPIVGVMPGSFVANPEAEIWIPLQADPNSANQGHYLAAAARLKEGVTLGQAQAEMHAIGERFRRQYPKMMDKDETVAVVPMGEALVQDITKALYILMAAVGLVLLIACANVANLLLARASARQREFAIRAAVGASRWRVVRQLLTESLVLAMLGGAVGLVLGVVGVRALLLLVPGDIPRLSDPGELQSVWAFLDWRILAFTAGISALTGILFGLFPALQISHRSVATTLKEAGTRSSTSRYQNLTRKGLVAFEMAMALVLLISAALLIRTFMSLSAAESGVNARHVLTALTSLTGGRYQTTEAMDLFTRQALQRIEAVPGVEAAATSIALPTTGGIDLDFDIPGKVPTAGQEHNGDEQWRSVSAHYFRVFQIPVQRGRVFDERDTVHSARVAIVNAAFAKKYFPGENAVGKSFETGKGLGPDFADGLREIVGVVGDVREQGLSGGNVPVMYIPQSQQPQGITRLANSAIPLAWAVRSAMDEKSLTAAMTKEIQAVDGQMPLARVRPMERILKDSLSRQNFNMLLLTIFAGSALVLAGIGIYGLMSYSVQQQTQELGVRIALGASKPALIALVLRQGMTPALVGVAGGLAIAFGLTRFMESLLYDVKPFDPLSFAGVAVILILVAMVGVLIPARRAMGVDPLVALRAE